MLEHLEGGLAFVRPHKVSVFTEEIGKRCSMVRVSANKAVVVIGEAEEGLNIGDILRSGPVR